jgi:hypothetical protein
MNRREPTEAERIAAELEAEDMEVEADDAPDDYDAVVDEILEDEGLG